MAFIDQKCLIFTPEEENKLEYTPVSHMESLLPNPSLHARLREHANTQSIGACPLTSMMPFAYGITGLPRLSCCTWRCKCLQLAANGSIRPFLP